MRSQVRIPPSAGTFVLQQDTSSTLPLSTQVYNGYPVGCERYLLLDLAYVRTSEVTHSQNAPQGVENVHYECRIDIESSDWG